MGVVGVGARAPLALEALSCPHGVDLVAALDPHPLAPQRAATRLRAQVPVATTLEGFLAHGLDLAFVTSPDHTHEELAPALLRAGVAVYLEKPLAITLPGALEILRAAKESGTALYVGHNMRHMAVVRTLRRLIQEGRVGQVKAIWCRHFVGHGGDFYFKDWHAERRYTTSLLLQKAAHDIDVMHWLADAYTERVTAMGGLTVYGAIASRADNSDQLMGDWFDRDVYPPAKQRGLNPVIDVEDLSQVLMRLPGDVYASYQQCHFSPDYWRNYTVIGTEGRLENLGDGAGGRVVLYNHRTGYNPDGDEVFELQEEAEGHGEADALTVAEFLRFLRFGAPTDTSPLAAYHAVATGIAATDSLRADSQPLDVPAPPQDLVDYFTNNQGRRPQ
ncbi:MAG: Gfo/Idh/MocA family oxidoreductase [Buchananella hordeovulneris]|nr:Gfo/Idh/MocA family oxidoreductase [Buchananella hordeovulneris]